MGADDDEDEGSIWSQRGFLAAAGAVAVVVILAVALAVSGNDEPSSGAGPKTPVPKAPTAKGDDTACNASTAGSQKPLTATPANTKWELLGRIAVPTAPRTYGPARRSGGLRSCFSRSAEGALYAAVNVIGATGYRPTRQAATKELTARGIGRDRAIAAEDKSDDSDVGLQIGGFRYTSYSKSLAVIDIASKGTVGSSAGDFHVSVAMRWEDNDWKLSVPDTGDPFVGAERLPDLGGYVRWMGA